MKKGLLLLIVVVAFLGVGFLFYNEAKAPGDSPSDSTPVHSFLECVAAGNPVAESYPRQCTSKDGQHFTEDIGNELEKQDLIVATTPRPNTEIKSPLSISGKARGFWFFEASFPIRLIDASGAIVAEGIATAKGDWMTESFVPYTSTLTFTKPTSATGTLILQKDNPSGMPENDDALIIPVAFE